MATHTTSPVAWPTPLPPTPYPLNLAIHAHVTKATRRLGEWMAADAANGGGRR